MHRLQFRHAPTPGFLSVVIPVFRDAQGLRATLSSLARQSLAATEFEILVCNDGADHQVSKLCRAHPVKEVRIEHNRGSYHARNRGVEQAAGEYLAFVDADITVPAHWLELGREALGRADYVGGPVVVDEAQAKSPADHYEVLTGFRGNHPNSGHNFFVTANLFVTRRVFESLGGFDQRLRSGGDNEFGGRVFASPQFSREFVEDLVVLHPPRGYRKLVKKKVRVAHGKEMLSHLYPERYQYRRPSLSRHILNVLVPPSPFRVRDFHKQVPQSSFLSCYLFRWRFKVETAVRLLPLYRRARRDVKRLRAGDAVEE